LRARELASKTERTVINFLSGIIDDVAASMTTEELLRLKMMAARLQLACVLALEARPRGMRPH
jgi:hypothetical protein